MLYPIDGQPKVVTAAPGDSGFNGWRWMVHALTLTDCGDTVAAVDTNGIGDIDSDAEVQAAIAGGLVTYDTVVAQFECPVIPVPHGRT
jgi:hypothetical protein